MMEKYIGIVLTTLICLITLSSGTYLLNGCDYINCNQTSCNTGGVYPNRINCTLYCRCVNGKPEAEPCPNGLVYNPIKQTCDIPQNVPSCNPNNGDPGTPGGTCPNTTCVDGSLISNPTNCSSYCQCDHGSYIQMTCPPGLYFNPNLQVCDWPANVDCGNNNGGNNKTMCPPQVSAQCPPDAMEGYAVHLPYPGDCTKFCKCDWGGAVEFLCPPGLHFNAELQVCDWPSNANCDLSQGGGGNDGQGTTTPSSGGNNNGGNNKTMCPPEVLAKCPPDAMEGYAVHLPYPGDCTKFCICDWGGAVEMPCPPYLHFNAELQVCDWPLYANCDPSLGGGSGGGGGVSPPPGTNPPPNGELVQCPSTVSCPVGHMEGNATILPHPTICSNFCKCSNNVPYLYECPADLVFNINSKICDWKKNVDCTAPRS